MHNNIWQSDFSEDDRENLSDLIRFPVSLFPTSVILSHHTMQTNQHIK